MQLLLLEKVRGLNYRRGIEPVLVSGYDKQAKRATEDRAFDASHNIDP
jgi:hypothetical protein